MEAAVEQITARARPKIKALLRSRAYYDYVDMLTRFKTHVWGLIEYHHGAILHSCESNLDNIDQLQNKFVRDIRLTKEMAFLDHNLAPLGLRRDIGSLGIIRKRVLGECHSSVKALLRFSEITDRWHDKQIDTYSDACLFRHNLYQRSLFGMIHIYNRLPQGLVSSTSVKEFQTRLTHAAKERCGSGDPRWQRAFRGCAELWETLRYL